ncbi:hypothetical protein [Flagellimonas sp. 2504JD4-2]
MIKYLSKAIKAFTQLLFLGIFMVQAQQSTFNLPDYHPVSPNAASLGSFGLYPVNKNLGTSNISVPIYNLSENGLNVPISLTYNTSGVKLNDLASWVGLGWSLNAGGAIIRNTKGLPDITYNASIPNLQNAAFTQANYDYMLGAVKGLRDTAPDQYVLSALGIGGSFYFDPDSGQAKFEDGSPIRVEVISADEMHVTLEDGTLLIFGTTSDNIVATEVTRHSNPNYTLDYVSAWYLTELVSSDRQDSISFRYKSQTLVQGYTDPAGESVYVNPSSSPYDPNLDLKAPYRELSQIDRQTLESIIFDNGHIDFESSFGRPDLEDDYKLDSIMVYFEDGTINDKLVDQYHFTYGEFVRSGGNFSRDFEIAPIFFNTARQINSRERSLKLLMMYRGASPNDGQVHSFEYNNTQLPIRCTTAQDAWGHPNTNMGTLLPQTETTVEAINSVYYVVGNGDRSSNEITMKAGVLEKITFPTGGYTTFEYEANRYLSTDQVYVPRSHLVRAFGEECNDPAYPHYDETTFTIPTGAKNIKLHISMSPVDYQGSSASYVALDGKFFYRPTPNSSGGPSDSSDGWYETIDINFGYNLGPDILTPVPFQPGTHTIKAFDTGYGPFAAYDCSLMALTITWDEPSGTQQVEKLVGGLRTKTISSYDGVSSVPVRVKRFEYADPNIIHPERNRGYIRKTILDTGFSLKPTISTSPHFNNNLGGEPVIEYGMVTEYDHDPVTGLDNGKTVSYYEQVPLTRTYNSITGPEVFKHPGFVWSYFFAQNLVDGNGWSLSAQNLLLDALAGPEEYSFYESRGWKRGRLSMEEVYKTESGSDMLIAKTENIYSTIESLKIRENFVFSPFHSAYESGWTITAPYNPDTDFNSIQFCYKAGETEIGRKVVSKTINTKYDDNGQNPVVTTMEYFYDNLVHKQPTRTKTFNSLGQVQETTITYPDDIASLSFLVGPDLSTLEKQAIDSLKTTGPLHRIAEPVQVETVVRDANDNILSSYVQRTDYQDWDVNLVLPKSVKSLKDGYNASNNPMQERIVYHDYDTGGNPIEFSKANAAHTYYVWGYNGTVPIAKLENFTTADATNIQATINAAVNASNLDVDNTSESALRDALDNIRSAATGAFVTTYTYDPLIGLNSVTDPKGYTMYYVYDSFNRLKEVRDGANNLVTDYQYHYKSQN